MKITPSQLRKIIQEEIKLTQQKQQINEGIGTDIISIAVSMARPLMSIDAPVLRILRSANGDYNAFNQSNPGDTGWQLAKAMWDFGLRTPMAVGQVISRVGNELGDVQDEIQSIARERSGGSASVPYANLLALGNGIAGYIWSSNGVIPDDKYLSDGNVQGGPMIARKMSQAAGKAGVTVT